MLSLGLDGIGSAAGGGGGLLGDSARSAFFNLFCLCGSGPVHRSEDEQGQLLDGDSSEQKGLSV